MTKKAESSNSPVAVIGLGYWGKNLVRNFHELGALRNPSRHIGWMCGCGERLAEELRCPACSTQYIESEQGLKVMQ